LNVVGTNRSETIRGTPKADRIAARGGNDRVFGLAGNDVLNGGPGRDVVSGGAGSDRLLLRDDNADTAVCGPGSDTVVADRADTVRADCETVLVPPPELAPPPPPRAPVVGTYGGQTSQGENVTFEARDGGTLTSFVLQALYLMCLPPDRPSLDWAHDFGQSSFPVRADGTFTIDESGVRNVAGAQASYRIVVTGRFTSGLANGAVTLDVSYSIGPVTYGCTAPNVTWTAASGVLNQPRRR
jgi:Ca2+-binding RTX toxin-like protein